MSESNGQPNINWDTMDGATWAGDDDAICREYSGKWVVALPGKVVAFGDDLDTVAQEAGRLLGIDPKTVVVRAITHPDEWFKDYPVYPGVSAPQSAG